MNAECLRLLPSQVALVSLGHDRARSTTEPVVHAFAIPQITSPEPPQEQLSVLASTLIERL